MKINYQKLEKKIKIKFSNSKLLIRSLTHKSYNAINNNEQLEFLGDRVLGLIIAIVSFGSFTILVLFTEIIPTILGWK